MTQTQIAANDKSARRIAALRAEVDETSHLLQTTLDSLLTRGERLEDLQLKADALEKRAKLFAKNTKEALPRSRCDKFWDCILAPYREYMRNRRIKKELVQRKEERQANAETIVFSRYNRQ